VPNAEVQDVPLHALGSPDDYRGCECPICYRLMEKPMLLVPCMHRLHRECIDEAKAAAGNGPFRCPMCGRPYPMTVRPPPVGHDQAWLSGWILLGQRVTGTFT
jgi:hypothetical protein